MKLAPVVLLACSALVGAPALAQQPDPQQPGTPPQERTGENRLVRNPLEVLREAAPEEVAFWLHMDGLDVEPVPVLLAEWDEYLGNLRRLYGAVLPMDSLLVTNAVRHFLEQRVALMSHEAELPAMVKKCNEISRKIKREVDFVRLVHQYTDDKTLKQVDGRAGIQSHSLMRYPLDLELFKLEVGDVVGPLWTLYGAEFFRAEEWVGEKGTLSEGVSVRQISLYFDTLDESQRRQTSRVRQHLRLRSDRKEFNQFLPPALQLDPPDHFGPTDVAPLGDPDKVLESMIPGKRVEDQVRDQKKDPANKDG